MHSACLDLQGCRLEFRSDDPDLVDWIGADFSAFTNARGSAAEITITALRRAPGRALLSKKIIHTRKWNILASPAGRRLVWYPEGALCDYDYGTRSGVLTSANPVLLRELSYLLILSRAGEALDLRGRHRLHSGALALDGKALLFCGAQGAGKTTLLLELLKDPAFSLLSDDTPLISVDGTVHPFPVRIGLGRGNPHLGRFREARSFQRRHYPPKSLIAPEAAGSAASLPVPPSMIFKLVKGAAPGFRRGRTGEAACELARSLLAGWGVPQMAEYFLRASPSDLARKAGIAASRLKAAGALLRKTDFYIFETGPVPALNAAALKCFLRSGSAPVSGV
jgi:hypothetical protein